MNDPRYPELDKVHQLLNQPKNYRSPGEVYTEIYGSHSRTGRLSVEDFIQKFPVRTLSDGKQTPEINLQEFKRLNGQFGVIKDANQNISAVNLFIEVSRVTDQLSYNPIVAALAGLPLPLCISVDANIVPVDLIREYGLINALRKIPGIAGEGLSILNQNKDEESNVTLIAKVPTNGPTRSVLDATLKRAPSNIKNYLHVCSDYNEMYELTRNWVSKRLESNVGGTTAESAPTQDEL